MNSHISAGDVSTAHAILDFGFERQFLPELKLLELEELIERNENSCQNDFAALYGSVRGCEALNVGKEEKRYKELEGMSEEELASLPPLDRDLTRARADMQALTREVDPSLSRALENALT